MGNRSTEVIVAGGSAGAIDALSAILPVLPRGFPIPLALVLHVAPDRPSRLADALGGMCALTVKEAEDKEPIAPGFVYVAPPNYHLLLERSRHLSLSMDEQVNFSRPAIDVTFESAADACGPALAGILLSGANSDGARGLAAIQRAGGLTIVQSVETAAVRTMPEAAIRLAPPTRLLPPAAIGPFLARLGRRVSTRTGSP
jgi:two-component system chemotaxis response regulator CheB